MANRTFNQFGGTLERKVVKLFAKISYTGSSGSPGVPTLVTSEVLNVGTSPITINPSQGFESLSDGGSGAFTLVLGANNGNVPTYDPYTRLLNVSYSASGTGNNIPVALLVTTDDVNASVGNPSLTLTSITTALAPTHLNGGATLLVEVTLSNTTAY